MLTIADVLEAEDVARVREGLAKAPFADGRRTAGGEARRVKANRQTDGADPGVQSLAAFVRKALPKQAWGTALAAFTIAFAASQIIGPVLTGMVADRFGSLRPGLVGSALVLFLGAAIALAQKDRRHVAARE